MKTPKPIRAVQKNDGSHIMDCAWCDFSMPPTDKLPHDWAALHLHEHPVEVGGK